MPDDSYKIINSNGHFAREILPGWDWYEQHKYDYTQSDIDSLSIEINLKGKLPQKTDVRDIRELMEVLRSS